MSFVNGKSKPSRIDVSQGDHSYFGYMHFKLKWTQFAGFIGGIWVSRGGPALPKMRDLLLQI